MYGNVVSTQEVASGANIKVPATAPIYPGYTFKGWALTNDEITALTEGKTIRAIYEKDATQTYTVKAAGATITVNGTDYNDKAENVAYDAKVTVTKAGATSWTVNGATVGYGKSYSFFCASDIELTAVKRLMTLLRLRLLSFQQLVLQLQIVTFSLLQHVLLLIMRQ